MAKDTLLIDISESDFHRLVHVKLLWEMNPDVEDYHASVEMLEDKWWNTIHTDVLKNQQLNSTHTGPQSEATSKVEEKWSNWAFHFPTLIVEKIKIAYLQR